MKRPGHDLSLKAIRHRRFHQNNPIRSTLLLENTSKSLLANITNIDDQLLNPVMNHVKHSLSHPSNDYCDMNLYRSDIRMILSELKFVTDYVRKEEEEDDISQDWKFSAMVIDRLCLILFTIMTTIFSYLTLFSAPNFFKLR
jgi:nicotinic acetylcholine receptor